MIPHSLNKLNHLREKNDNSYEAYESGKMYLLHWGNMYHHDTSYPYEYILGNLYLSNLNLSRLFLRNLYLINLNILYTNY